MKTYHLLDTYIINRLVKDMMPSNDFAWSFNDEGKATVNYTGLLQKSMLNYTVSRLFGDYEHYLTEQFLSLSSMIAAEIRLDDNGEPTVAFRSTLIHKGDEKALIERVRGMLIDDIKARCERLAKEIEQIREAGLDAKTYTSKYEAADAAMSIIEAFSDHQQAA